MNLPADLVYDKIAVMLPTYKRSGTHLPLFLRSALGLAEDTERLHFFLCVNEKDKETQDFLEEFDFNGAKFTMFTEKLPAPHLAKYFNALYKAARSLNMPNMVVTMFGDDMQFETLGWDTRMLSLINSYKGVGVFWANDMYIAQERCPVNLFVTQPFVEATERPFMCEEFSCEMIDVLWGTVGKYTKTSHYDPDTHIRHNHNYSKPNDQRDEAFHRMAYNAVHAAGGKARAKQIGREIADILIAKGLTGDSIC